MPVLNNIDKQKSNAAEDINDQTLNIANHQIKPILEQAPKPFQKAMDKDQIKIVSALSSGNIDLAIKIACDIFN